MIRVGCCGFPVKKETYYKTFSVVEIQQSFYQLPRIETGKRWKEETPRHFEFTMKAWQLITHEPSSPTYRRLRMAIPEKKKIDFEDEVFEVLTQLQYKPSEIDALIKKALEVNPDIKSTEEMVSAIFAQQSEAVSP